MFSSSDSYVPGPEMEIPGIEKTKKMFIGNLPADINKVCSKFK